MMGDADGHPVPATAHVMSLAERVDEVRGREALGVVRRIGPSMGILLLLFAVYDWISSPPDQRVWRLVSDLLPALVLGLIVLAQRRGHVTQANAGWIVVLGSLTVSAAVLATVLVGSQAATAAYLLVMTIVNGASALSTRQYVAAQSVPLAGVVASYLLLDGVAPPGTKWDWIVVVVVTVTASVAVQVTREHAFREMARILALFEQQAAEDPLTGLGTRRALEQLFGVVRSSAEVAGLLVFTLFVDIDGLKRVNDELGHDAGDQVILAVARALRESARSRDVLVRWGGDEFAVLGMGDSEAPARLGAAVSERLAALNPAPSVWEGTASIGTATLPAAEASLAALVSESDAAMYERRRAERRTPGSSDVVPPQGDRLSARRVSDQ